MTDSKIFLYFCLAFAGGIFLDSFLSLATSGIIYYFCILGGLVLGISLFSVFQKHKQIAVFGFCLIFFVLGIWRHSQAEVSILRNELKNFNDRGDKIVLTGIVSAEPKFSSSSQKLTIKVNQLDFEDENLSVAGKVLIFANKYPEYKYGDELKITGELKSPTEDLDGFNYKNYLEKDGIFSTISWPEIKIIGQNKGNVIHGFLFSFKEKLQESMTRFMSPPQSALLEALFGDEGNISQEWKDKFNITGTRHITAVSGMNITIICALIFNFLLALGFWRNHAFYIAVVFIVFYIIMIGAPASAVRAGIMGIIFMTAQHFGRMSAGGRAVAFASVFMLFLNPFLLKFDVGFQLSFLAVLGLIYLQPVFMDIFQKVPNIFQLRFTLAATISAQIFTLPVLIYNFGRIPVLSVLSNILIVPTLSFATLLGFFYSVLGLFSGFLGQVFSWTAWLILTYVIKVIDLFSKIPFATLQVQNVSWILLVVSYLLLGFWLWRIRQKQKLKFLEY